MNLTLSLSAVGGLNHRSVATPWTNLRQVLRSAGTASFSPKPVLAQASNSSSPPLGVPTSEERARRNRLERLEIFRSRKISTRSVKLIQDCPKLWLGYLPNRWIMSGIDEIMSGIKTQRGVLDLARYVYFSTLRY